LDHIVDTLVICADVTSLATYLAEVQVLELSDFSASIDYFDHLNVSLGE